MSEVPGDRDTILVVDDSPDTLTMLTDALEQSGANVLVSISGLQALDLVERITPDLILLDAVMPHPDGFETCRRFRSLPALATTPIIFMTGLSEPAHIVRGLEAGGVDYVTKPLVLDVLLARIQTHLTTARVARNARLALDTAGRHLLATDREGRVLWCTPQARVLLALEMSEDPAERPALVGALRDALREKADGVSVSYTTPRGMEVALAFLGEITRGELLFRLSSEDRAAQVAALRQQFGLTGREAEVLLWIGRGKSNRDIADILGLSPRTVNKHLEQIFSKLGVENRASAATLVVRCVAS